jgi:hypothetical protein
MSPAWLNFRELIAAPEIEVGPDIGARILDLPISGARTRPAAIQISEWTLAKRQLLKQSFGCSRPAETVSQVGASEEVAII